MFGIIGESSFLISKSNRDHKELLSYKPIVSWSWTWDSKCVNSKLNDGLVGPNSTNDKCQIVGKWIELESSSWHRLSDVLELE